MFNILGVISYNNRVFATVRRPQGTDLKLDFQNVKNGKIIMFTRTKYMCRLMLSMCLLVSFAITGLGQPIKEEKSNLLPHLKKQGTATQLVVDGRPYLVLAGELHNSSSSSIEYMRPIWSKLQQMNLNTVLAVVSWDLLEPEEGKFDFTIVDSLIEQARSHDLRLVILWFGSWKNGISHYVPYWVKKDLKRFPRVRIKNDKNIEVLSTLCEANWQADARAFAALMKHIRKIDSKEHTVIMIQIENEVGILGDSRDCCDMANAAFAGQVPDELMQYLLKHRDNLLPELKEVWSTTGYRKSGTWTEVFGTGVKADEVFMAWNYAQYLDRIAEAGKEEYPIPMYVNAWIIQPRDKVPGDYPSGGPQAHNHDIWRAGALHIDILAPDIYLPNFEEICRLYSRSGNPLFIPESRAGIQGAANAFYAIGEFNAIGYSPFGIDSKIADPENGPMPQAYDVLSQLSALILEHQGKDSITSVILDKQNPSRNITMGCYTLEVALRQQRWSPAVPSSGYCMIILTESDEFVVAGNDIQITFFANTPGPEIVGLASVYEGRFVDGRWIPGRKLNGDAIMLDYHLDRMAAENRPGSVLRLQGESPGIQKVKLYRF